MLTRKFFDFDFARLDNFLNFGSDKKKTKMNERKENTEPLTHAYAHLLVDMHLAVFAPAFTFSLSESECSRKPQVRIASVVMPHSRKTNTIQEQTNSKEMILTLKYK